MSKRAFEKIKQGLEEARAYLDGTADRSRYRVHLPPQSDPTLHEIGSGMDRKVYRPGAAAPTPPRSTTGKPGMRGGWKKRR